MRLPHALRLAGSLLALGAGLFVLVGDSTDDRCTKGRSGLHYEATFESTCGVPSSGHLAVDFPSDSTPNDGTLVNQKTFEAALGDAGLTPVAGSSDLLIDGQKVCNTDSARFDLALPGGPVRKCGSLSFRAESTTVPCDTSGVVPVLGLEPKDIEDAAADADPELVNSRAPSRCTITFRRTAYDAGR